MTKGMGFPSGSGDFRALIFIARGGSDNRQALLRHLTYHYMARPCVRTVRVAKCLPTCCLSTGGPSDEYSLHVSVAQFLVLGIIWMCLHICERRMPMYAQHR